MFGALSIHNSKTCLNLTLFFDTTFRLPFMSSSPSPLHIAARTGNIASLKQLLSSGSNPNSRDRLGKTPLHEACASGHLECVQLLFESGAIVSSHKTNGFTPLHSACANNHQNIASFLLSHGSHASDPDHKGETPIHLASRGGFLTLLQTLVLIESAKSSPSSITSLKQAVIASSLPSNEPFPNQSLTSSTITTSLSSVLNLVNLKTNNGRTPLHSAAKNGHVKVLEWLLSQGADSSTADVSSIQPCHEAAASGSLPCLVALISAGANPMAVDSARCTPLHHAAVHGHLSLSQKLVSMGADPNAVDFHGATPLYWAASSGRVDVVSWLLGLPGSEPNSRNTERSALHVAAGWGHDGVVEALLRGGADVFAKDREGRTALELVLSLPEKRMSLRVIELLKGK